MAEAILEIVLEKFSSFAAKELGLFLGFNRDKKKLESMFTAIKATLQDAEEKQFSNDSIKDWLRKLKAVAYELDDIMDECAYEELGLDCEGVKCGLSDKVQSSCLSSFHPKHIIFQYKIAKRMKSISERLDEIAKEREQLHLTEAVTEKTSGVPEWRQTTSLITEPQVYGREKDRDKIVEFLVCDATHSMDLSVYPILGLGGLGKTTLAQLVFNHERVVKHFELRIWVCVSEDFSLKRMTKAIIEVASGHASEDLEQELLQRKLQDLLRSKRYLLVLDDVWDEEQENWQRLKSVLACDAEGASILVTTRLSNVASIMGTRPPHELSMLSYNDCWELFKHRAFGPDEVAKVALEDIGKEIVKKCGGVPLAAKALGGLLRFERKEEAWLNVKESNLWSLTHNIMPALRLSYLNLPIKLRPCFAYCAIFPQDTRIVKQDLIELWMANGFISSDRMLDAENVGDRVWYELYWRSFFQDIETDQFGKVTSFKMHDLVHDLAKFVAKEVCCITEGNVVTTLSERIHHLSVNYWFTRTIIQLHKVKSLRTSVLLEKYRYYNVSISSHVLKCYALRVLDYVQSEKLSSSIGDLKHLRYLNLSKGRFKTLPNSLCKLWHLQILKLDDCNNLQKLPNRLIRLKSLQQLSLNGCYKLSSLPPQIGKLTSLRSLSTYIVGKERGFLLVELGQLKLKGDLHIKHLGEVKSVEDAKEANMSSKQLKGLLLSWDRKETSDKESDEEEILEVLQPDTQQLESLKVEGYKGAHFPQWMSSPSLEHLTDVRLVSCGSCSQLPALGKLPSLKKLWISDMIGVKYLYEESHDGGVVFMALEILWLENLPNLIRFSRDERENMFPCLSTLEIEECPNFLAEEVLLQGMHSLKELNISRCNKFYVSAGFQGLTRLEELTICKCREVEGLHEALQHMTALKELHLGNLPNLESLPDCFENLPLLRYLDIWNCYKLTSLPTSLSLSRLSKLRIDGCNPELKKRCEKETGEDWPKIAHIRYVTVW